MNPTEPAPQDDSDRRAHLGRLRAEVAALEADLGDHTYPGRDPEDPAAAAGPTAPAGRRRDGWWRGPVVVGCLVLLAILAPAAVLATWAHDEVADTDRFVQTMAPLSEDPAVREAVSDRITDELTSRLDVRGITRQAVDALADQGLPEGVAVSLSALGTPLASGVENFVAEQVARLVSSPQFADAWTQATREAHGQMVAVLTGETGQAVEVEGTAVRLNLAVVIDAVKARLVDAGFTLAERLPTVTAQFTIFESADLARAQTGFRVLEAAARALPVLVLALIGVAVLTARRRRHTLMVTAFVVAGSMLVLGLGLNVFRVVYLDAVPTDRLPADAAAAVYDTLVRFIRTSLRSVLILALVLGAVAWVAGPGTTPVAVRRTAARLLDSSRRGSTRLGVDTGRFGAALGRNRSLIQGGIAAVVAVTYVLADHPTGAWTVRLLVAAAAVVLVVELLARPATASGPGTAPASVPRVPAG